MTAIPRVVSIFDSESRKPNKFSHTKPDIVVLAPDSIKQWKTPPFQRPVRINEKVKEYCEQLKANEGVFPGTPMQVGIWEGEKYLVDGQHRKEAFLLSGLQEGICNVIYTEYADGPEGMTAMANDWVTYNSKLVSMRPDDLLRAMESGSDSMQLLRRRCPFVGYDMIRRNPKAPLLSMSTLLRCWFGSAPEVPHSGGLTAAKLAANLSTDEAGTLSDFLSAAHSAWGGAPEYARLWSSLNLTLCAWLYRRLVIAPYSPRSPKITRDTFSKLLMSLSANGKYLDYLVGRQLTDRDRNPCYQRIKVIFAARLTAETGRKVSMPQPAWASHIRV